MERRDLTDAEIYPFSYKDFAEGLEELSQEQVDLIRRNVREQEERNLTESTRRGYPQGAYGVKKLYEHLYVSPVNVYDYPFYLYLRWYL